MTLSPSSHIFNCDLCGEVAVRKGDGGDVLTPIIGPFTPELFEVLGQLVVAFAMAENGVDFLVDALRRYRGIRISKRIPQVAKHKVQLLIGVVDEFSGLSYQPEELLEQLNALDELLSRRNHYVHGIYEAYRGALVFQKMTLYDDGLVITDVPATIASMRKDRATAMTCGVVFMSLALQLAQRYGSSSLERRR